MSSEDESYQSYFDVGLKAATEIKRNPEQIDFIVAKGYLSYELLNLMGGDIQFLRYPWWYVFHHIIDFFWGILSVIRWFPPDNSTLELVGEHSQNETEVFRLLRDNEETIVFFVEFEPDSPYKYPRLKEEHFLKPPFEKDDIIENTNAGLWQGFVEGT